MKKDIFFLSIMLILAILGGAKWYLIMNMVIASSLILCLDYDEEKE